MATVTHCLYCFEALSSSLENRKSKGLGQIEECWDQFVNQDAQEFGENTSGNATGTQDAVDDEEEGPSSHVLNGVIPSRVLSCLPARLTVPGDSSASSTSSLSNVSNASSRHAADSPLSVSSSRSSLSSASAPSTARSKDISRVPPIRSLRHPMFVTWNTISSAGQKRLRGCIGTFEALELEHGLKTYALTAAFEDTRFPRIEAVELPSLECSVTLLTDFETAPGPLAWDIGTHGLRISFTHHSRRYGATYLPDVALEQGWTKVETLVSLMRKAGWRGRSSEWQKVTDLNVVRYQGKRVAARYEDWWAFHEWVTEQQR